MINRKQVRRNALDNDIYEMHLRLMEAFGYGHREFPRWLRRIGEAIEADPSKYAELRAPEVSADAPKRSYTISLEAQVRRKALQAVATALKHGPLVRLRCEVCKRSYGLPVHSSYHQGDWLSVRWICKPCQAIVSMPIPTYPSESEMFSILQSLTMSTQI